MITAEDIEAFKPDAAGVTSPPTPAGTGTPMMGLATVAAIPALGFAMLASTALRPWHRR